MQYRLVLEYDGTDYHGWQLQPNARTLQGVVEEALATVLRHPARVAAPAGPTPACTRSARSRPSGPSARSTARAAKRAERADAGRRRRARGRRGARRVRRPPRRPLARLRVPHLEPAVALGVLAPLQLARRPAARRPRDAARGGALPGTHDFSAFRAADCEAKSPVRTVTHSGLAESRERLASIGSRRRRS